MPNLQTNCHSNIFPKSCTIHETICNTILVNSNFRNRRSIATSYVAKEGSRGKHIWELICTGSHFRKTQKRGIFHIWIDISWSSFVHHPADSVGNFYVTVFYGCCCFFLSETHMQLDHKHVDIYCAGNWVLNPADYEPVIKLKIG